MNDGLGLVYTYLNKDTKLPEWPNGLERNDKIGFESMIYSFGYSIDHFLKLGLQTGVFNLTNKQKYLYPIEISNVQFWRVKKNSKLFIPDQVVQDTINGKAKIMFINSAEGDGFSDDNSTMNCTKHKINLIKNQSRIYNIPLSKFVYVDSNYFAPTILSKEGIQGEYLSFWQHTLFYKNIVVPVIKNIEGAILSKKLKFKKFICLNRKPVTHRAWIVNRLLELDIIKDNIVTFPERFTTNINDCYGSRLEMLKECMPLKYDQNDILNPTANVTWPDPELQSKATFNIITETYFEHDSTRMFYSEKVFKSIVCLQPFIVVGQPYYLKYLRDMGYKTFNDYIDESYDEIIDSNERLEKIVQLAKSINNMSFEQLSELHYNMYPILKHNFEIHEQVVSGNYKCDDLNRSILNNW